MRLPHGVAAEGSSLGHHRRRCAGSRALTTRQALAVRGGEQQFLSTAEIGQGTAAKRITHRAEDGFGAA